ncbi:hypothetical protein PGQ11_014799 [Apiospora arundinis]|uniref:Uncharacterized protein n=1 Tax=Apiospora arundinis TaxID=335852 RepID=A0ABR2HTB0_9PEZI
MGRNNQPLVTTLPICGCRAVALLRCYGAVVLACIGLFEKFNAVTNSASCNVTSSGFCIAQRSWALSAVALNTLVQVAPDFQNNKVLR